MTIFGVCNCDLNLYEPKVENLITFDSYDDAYNYYMNQLNKQKTGYALLKDLWIVYIDNNHIVQFDQLTMISKTKFIKI